MNDLAIIKGTLSKVFVDEEGKVSFTVKAEAGSELEELRKVFEHTSKKWVPNWVKDNTNNVTLHSNYKVPLKDTEGNESYLQREHRGYIGRVAINIKEGAIYPYAIVLDDIDPDYTATTNYFDIFN